MKAFEAHSLRFTSRATSDIAIPGHHGSALRGALFDALRGGRNGQVSFCYQGKSGDCAGCQIRATCPVATLLAPVDYQGRRGWDIPRPFRIDLTQARTTVIRAGQEIEFGITLFAGGVSLFPYVILAAREVGRQGVGVPLDRGDRVRRRGSFDIERVVARNPLTGEAVTVMEMGDNVVRMPTVPVTHDQVLSTAKALEFMLGNNGGEQITIRFVTPTRLVEGGRLAQRPHFRVVIQRLIERLSSLWEEYSDTTFPIDFAGAMAEAEQVTPIKDETAWEEVTGYSSRAQRPTDLGGIVGRVTYGGPVRQFLPLLIWGSVVGVGKDTAKGNGMFAIESAGRG